jgi:hypothetical protein
MPVEMNVFWAFVPRLLRKKDVASFAKSLPLIMKHLLFDLHSDYKQESYALAASLNSLPNCLERLSITNLKVGSLIRPDKKSIHPPPNLKHVDFKGKGTTFFRDANKIEPGEQRLAQSSVKNLSN